MTDTALLAVLIAGVGGILAGRAWAASRERSPREGRPAFRASPHYTQGLHYLATGQLDPATHELAKVLREHPDAVEVQQVLSHLHREVGQVEKAIDLHRTLLARSDLTRAERAHALASLGTDYRRAGFLDRAAQAYDEALEVDPRNLLALEGQQKLFEERREWRQAYEAQTRLARLRKSDDGLVLAYLQTEMGHEAALAGLWEEAEAAFRTALSLDQRATPAYLALADLWAERDPARTASILESAIAAAPERAYLAFAPLEKAYARSGEHSRFVDLCERLIEQDPRDWRARLALARHLRAEGRPGEALGLLLRALESNPHVLLVHLEVWRTLRALGQLGPDEQRYVTTVEESALYVDPHICTVCRYRADDMLWRCPHCHEWNTFVEERVGPAAGGQV
ncbi:MAG: tetratricopeptide repeat protein [Acidobacteria bacterium]|jgi:lipopolysaccharide biosynthesis regulator YciM|nr:tetratricopeptide repeat protein [Acidobacteriota bacterium]